jgi:hypothetical protein
MTPAKQTNAARVKATLSPILRVISGVTKAQIKPSTTAHEEIHQRPKNLITA